MVMIFLMIVLLLWLNSVSNSIMSNNYDFSF